MTKPAPLTVPAGERGVLRLFALNMPAEQVRFLSEPGAIDQMLGVTGLETDQAEIIAIRDLDQMGLAGYLTEGCGVPEAQIDRAALAALTGHVLLLRSRAFGGRAATLTPAPQLVFVASYTEPATDWHADPQSPRSEITRRTPPRIARAQASRIGFALFAVMMSLIAVVLYLVIT